MSFGQQQLQDRNSYSFVLLAFPSQVAISREQALTIGKGSIFNSSTTSKSIWQLHLILSLSSHRKPSSFTMSRNIPPITSSFLDQRQRGCHPFIMKNGPIVSSKSRWSTVSGVLTLPLPSASAPTAPSTSNQSGGWNLKALEMIRQPLRLITRSVWS